TSGFTLSTGNMELLVENLKLLDQPRGVYVGRLKGNFGPYASIDLQGVTFLNANQTFDITTTDGLHLSDISIEGGTVTLKQPPGPRRTKEKKETPPIRADHLLAQNIRFVLEQDGRMGISSQLDIDANNFLLSNQVASWSSLLLGSTAPALTAGKTGFKAGSLQLQYPGILTFIKPAGHTSGPFASIRFEAETMRVGIGLSSTALPSLEIKGLELEQPVLQVKVLQKPTGMVHPVRDVKPLAKPVFLEYLRLIDPKLDFSFTDSAGNTLHKSFFEKGELLATNFRLANDGGGPQLTLDGLRLQIADPSATIRKLTLKPSSIYLKASNLLYQWRSKALRLHVDSMMVKDIAHQWVSAQSDSFEISATELGVIDLAFAGGDTLNWKSMLHENKWWLKGAHLRWHNPKQKVQVHNLWANHTRQVQFGLDSMKMQPQPDRHSYWMSQPYEKDYITLQTGSITGLAPSINLRQQEPGLYLHKLVMNNMVLVPQRDKTRPEDTVTYRPLLASQIAGIPIPLKIDSLVLLNGTVQYHEIGKKTGREGLIFLDRINGTIVNIKNRDLTEKDSLILRMATRLYGKGPVQLGHWQSYTDTLQGFVLRIRMGQFGMREMNAFLRPQMGLLIRGGTIDTMSLLVKGNKYFAYGTMDMRFQDMSVRLLGEGEKEKYFGANFINWLINQILRRHDNGKADLIFKERVQKRGQFNFWGKIALEGVLTNIGVKSDRREKMKFKKELKEYNLPREYWDD
ncbi:MAG: hypothetical protein MUF29_08160, partial [Chitinophagaceae bacterium]|nr:hypothetical protein [Chitinophagaceae bacterium]